MDVEPEIQPELEIHLEPKIHPILEIHPVIRRGKEGSVHMRDKILVLDTVLNMDHSLK